MAGERYTFATATSKRGRSKAYFLNAALPQVTISA